ncbi:21784_t:CDS:2 [Rhizophagus irregularis]|nr:21784_t:CDS:2 [Rhizophagus irregularis]
MVDNVKGGDPITEGATKLNIEINLKDESDEEQNVLVSISREDTVMRSVIIAGGSVTVKVLDLSWVIRVKINDPITIKKEW